MGRCSGGLPGPGGCKGQVVPEESHLSWISRDVDREEYRQREEPGILKVNVVAHLVPLFIGKSPAFALGCLHLQWQGLCMPLTCPL